MEPNYNIKKECEKWLQMKKEPKIRTGKEYQAMIPECDPKAYVIKIEEAKIYNLSLIHI